MAFSANDDLGLHLTDLQIRRDEAMDELMVTWQVLEDQNADINRQLIRANLNSLENRGKLQRTTIERDLLKSTVTELQDKLEKSQRTAAHLEGQVDTATNLNRQLTNQFGVTHGSLCAARSQLVETLNQNSILRTQNQRLKDFLLSNHSASPDDIEGIFHATSDLNGNEQHAVALIQGPGRIENHDQQLGTPTFTQHQHVTSFPNGHVLPNGPASNVAFHQTEVNTTLTTTPRSNTIAFSKPNMGGIVRGGKNVQESFNRFLQNQNPQLVAIRINNNATLTTVHGQALRSNALLGGLGPSNALGSRFNPQCVPFTPSASVTTSSGPLNPLSEPFIPGGHNELFHKDTLSHAMASTGRMSLNPAEPFGPTERNDSPTETTNTHATPKPDDLQSEPNTSLPGGSAQSGKFEATNETLDTGMPGLSTDKVKSTHLDSEQSSTRNAVSATVGTTGPVAPVAATNESKLPPQKCILQSAAKEEVSESSMNLEAQTDIDKAPGTGDAGPSKFTTKDETSMAASSTDAALSKWLDTFDNQTSASPPNGNESSISTAEGNKLISFDSSPTIGVAKLVPIPPGFTPMEAPAAPTAAKNGTDNKQGYTVPKDEKDIASTFMAAAISKLSDFQTKYGTDPEADTRKELAAQGQALKIKFGTSSSEGSSPQNELDHSGKEYVPREITSTRVLGEVLDDESKARVLKENCWGKFVELKLDWKTKEEDGKTVYVL